MKKFKWYEWLIGIVLVGSLVVYIFYDKPIIKFILSIMIVISIAYSLVRRYREKR